MDKYKETITKIQASDELKQKILQNIEQERSKNNESIKGGIIIKIKQIVLTIASILGMLVGSGVVYATAGGTINGVPVFEWLDIKFAKEYVEYIQPVENQFVENDNMRLDLISTVSDDGFIVLDFELTMKDKNLIDEDGFDKGLPIEISFNDKLVDGRWTRLNTSYNTLIIDGKEIVKRGNSLQDIKTIIPGQKYEIYQLYFLTEEDLNNKENFTLTLKNPVIQSINDHAEYNEQNKVINGEFYIELSREKASQNTNIITSDNSALKYNRLEQKLDKVMVTPLQNIVKITTTLNNVTEDNWTDLSNKDFIENPEYRIYNNNNRINGYVLDTDVKIIYKDNTVEHFIPGEVDTNKSVNGSTIVTTTYVAFEKDEYVKNSKLEVYSGNAYTNELIYIGNYSINFNNNKVSSENKGNIMNKTYDDYQKEEEIFQFGEADYDEPVIEDGTEKIDITTME